MASFEAIAPVYRGQDAVLNFTLTPTTDITAWTMSFRVKLNQTDATPILGPISASITSASAGTFSVALTAAQTTTLPAGQ